LVIFVLRHADRTSSSVDALSPAGVERSRRLGRMLAESGVSVAYCSDALRTRETLAPLKQALGDALTINEVPGGAAAHSQAVAAAIEALPAATVVAVVSHSDTVGLIIEALGGGSIAPIAGNEFDRLFVLFGPADGNVTLLQLRY
jgi:phosphohistidine phosphatase SixA